MQPQKYKPKPFFSYTLAPMHPRGKKKELKVKTERLKC
jgi:hypothetical protein